MGNFENKVKEVLSRIDNRLKTLKVGRVDQNSTTAVIASQSEDVALTSDTPETIPFNNEELDILEEFENGSFTPKRDGLYSIDIMAEFSVGSDQDELKLSLVNEDSGDSVVENEIRSSGSNNRDRSFSTTVQLDGGTSYHIEAENSDNDDTINGKPKRTRLVIYCSGIDPEVLE